MMQISEINDVAGLAAIRPAWSELLSQTAGASFFQTCHWLEVYWRHFGSGQKLRVLVACESGKPSGILPLVVRSEPTKAGRLRFLTYPLDSWGSFYGPIGPCSDRTLAAGLGHIRGGRRDWDAIELRWLDCEGVDGGQSQAAFRGLGFQGYRTAIDQTAIIDLAGTWQEYLASHTSKWRNNFKRWQRKLAELGELSYVRHRPAGELAGDADPRWDLYEACETLAQRSWQGSSTTGTTLSHAPVREFLRDLHLAAAKAGGVDMNLLFLDGRPIAFAYNYQYKGHVFGLRVGYDAATAKDGAGNLLYARTIEDSFTRGDHTYDMGPGSLECKEYFKTRLQTMYRLSHFRPGIRAQLVRFKRWADEKKLVRLATSAK